MPEPNKNFRHVFNVQAVTFICFVRTVKLYYLYEGMTTTFICFANEHTHLWTLNHASCFYNVYIVKYEVLKKLKLPYYSLFFKKYM